MKVKLNSPTPSKTVAPIPPPAESLSVGDAISLVNSYFADRHVEQQTIALLQHLSERLSLAEANQAALMNALKLIAEDSSSSRDGLLTAISSISERLAEAPNVNVTVPVPEVNVNVEPPAPRRIEFERNAEGRIEAAEEVDA